MRGQQQAKIITPPGSDYTDAYLSAFASKPIPTRHIHRFNTAVYANSAPIPLKPTTIPLSTSTATKTSETRFVNNSNIQTSTLFDKPVSSSSSRSSTYSSSFVPERPPTYEPFSSTQYSAPQSQTFTSSYSTLLRTPTSTNTNISSPSTDSQRSYTTFQNRYQTTPTSTPTPTPSTFPTVYRSGSVYENIYKPLPPYSIQYYPPSNTYTTSLSSSSSSSIGSAYKSFVPFPTVPLSSSYNINRSSTSENIVLPTSTIEKQINRPETLLFQHNEDIQSSSIKKPSPIFTPSPESPVTREELKVEPENLHMEELTTNASESVQIYEDTLSKYDLLINQISEVLASVSPLSSIVSSTSPSKSLVDYQLSSDSSPILPHKHTESQSSTTVENSSTQRTKPSHLIRDDSYDKIVTVISDLDNEIISSSDAQNLAMAIKAKKEEVTAPLIIQEEKEETEISPSDEHQVPPAVKEDKEELKISSIKEQQDLHTTQEETKSSSLDEYQSSPITTEETNKEIQTASTLEQQTRAPVEEIKEETKTSSTDEQQTPSTSITQEEKEEVKTSLVEEQQVPSVTEENDKEPTIAHTAEHQISLPSKEEETKTLSTDEQQTSSIAEQQDKEETTTASVEDHPTTSFVGETKEETKVPSSDEQQVSSTSEKVKAETETTLSEEHQISSASKEEETKTLSTDEPQTSSIAEQQDEEETTTASVEEHPTTSFVEETKEETKVPSLDEQQVSSASEKVTAETETTLSEEHQTSSVTEKEKEKDETKTQSSDEHQTSSIVEKEEEKPKIFSSNEQPVPSADIPASEILQSAEAKSDEKKVVDEQSKVETTSENAEFVQEQSGLLTNVPNDVPVPEETTQASIDAALAKKGGKRVTWDETVVDNEDDESLSQQSLTEENTTSETPIITTPEDKSIPVTTEEEYKITDESKAIVNQQITPLDITESQTTFDQTINPPISSESSIVLSSTIDQQVTSPTSVDDVQTTSTEQQLKSSSYSEDQTTVEAATDEQIYQTDVIAPQIIPSDSIERQTKSSSILETSLNSSDSTNQQIISSDLTESQVSFNERQIRSTSPTDTQLISVTDSSKEDTLTADEVSTTASDIISNEILNKPVEESEITKTESKETITIVGGIDTLTDTIANRYISSDVYHGCLGQDRQLLQDISEIDDDSTTKSLFFSLRETITAPITPLIESIHAVFSSTQTTTATYSLNTESEVNDHQQDETRLTGEDVTKFKTEISDEKSQIEENKSTRDISEESKTIFESLREAVASPITAVTETIQTVVSNLQSDNQEVLSTFSSEQLTTGLEENGSTVEIKSSSFIVQSSDEKTDDNLNKEIEQTQASLFSNIQEKLSKTLTTLTETIHDAVSSKDIHTEDQQAIQQEKPDAHALEESASTDTAQDETETHHIQSYDNFVTDTTVPASSDSISITTEETNKQKEKEEKLSAELSPSEIQEPTSAVQTTEELTRENVESTPITQHDEQVLTPAAISSEQVDIIQKQEIVPAETSEITSVDQKIDEIPLTKGETNETISSTATTEHDEQVSGTTLAPSEQIDFADKQETTTFEKSSEITTEQKSDESTSTETKTTLEVIRDIITHPLATITEKIQNILPTSTTEQTENTTSDIAKPLTSTSEEAETLKEQNVFETENSGTVDYKTDSSMETENVESTEIKTTLETIREVITHPLATITEKIQSIISSSHDEPVEQTSSDTTKSFIHTSEQTESSEKQPSLETTDASTLEQNSDSPIETENLESTETKTTFETLRDVITHPLATITEKIQSVISHSTTEEVPSSEQQTSTTTIDLINKDEDNKSAITELTLQSTQDTITKPSTTVSETVQDIVSNAINQTSSYQEDKQILKTQGSESLSQDQIQGEQEKNLAIIPSQISNNENLVQRTESESESTTNTEIQDLISHEIDVTTSDTNKILLNTIRDLINDTINTVIFQLSQHIIEDEQINQEIFSSDSGLTSPITVINVGDRSESSQSTINQETITNEEDISDNNTAISDMTWTNLVSEKSSDEKHEESFQEIKQLLEEVIQLSDNITVEIAEQKPIIILSNQTQSLPIIENIIQQTTITPQVDDIMQLSSNEIESHSASPITEIENVPSKPSIDFREISPGNNEDDSLELIHALQGHSIILASSSPIIQTQTTTNESSSISPSAVEKTDEHILQTREKSSSSTTTSSQITSSDRYVSYAIHEMGDSSQERLPAFPLAADIPIYELVKTISDENKEQKISSEPIVNINQNITKDDDLTELDATENLTSYSDDVLLQKLYSSAPNRQENLDASSTDEDVDEENFNEFEQHDVSNLHRIIDEITHQSNSLSGGYEQTYQRYDVSSNSSTSTKPQTDDIYIIPGYPGLWKPSADDDESSHSPLANDADDEDERKQTVTKVKTRTIVRTTNPAKLQSFLQHQHQDITTQDIPLRPDTIDVFNRPLNEFSFDISESDSFKTCASTITSSSVSKQQKQSELFPLSEQQHQTSPEEKIFLIRERERGVSLPVTMKIDCDDMALRLSTSTPIDAQLYSTTQTDLPSTYSEPSEKTTSSSRASTPSLSSNESEQQKLPSSSWLNTINTFTTTIEGPNGPLESRTTIHKSAKGPISIAECDAQGKYIIIENTSRSKNIALANWTIRQENDNGEKLTFTFPDNCLLRPNHSLKIFTKPNESERRNSDLIASLLSSWHTGSNVVTTLINAEGKDRASLTKKTLFS